MLTYTWDWDWDLAPDNIKIFGYKNVHYKHMLYILYYIEYQICFGWKYPQLLLCNNQNGHRVHNLKTASPHGVNIFRAKIRKYCFKFAPAGLSSISPGVQGELKSLLLLRVPGSPPPVSCNGLSTRRSPFQRFPCCRVPREVLLLLSCSHTLAVHLNLITSSG